MWKYFWFVPNLHLLMESLCGWFFFVHVYVHGAREHYVKTVFVSPEYMMGTKPKMLNIMID